MKAREIMTHDVECVAPDASLREVASRMKAHDVGFIPVCDGDRLKGAITDRDIVVRVLAEGRDVALSRASDVMSTDVFFTFEDDTLEQVAHVMQEKEVRRVLVLDRNKRLVGVISLGDLSQAKEKLAGQTTKDITKAA